MVFQIYIFNSVFSFEPLTCLSNHLLLIFNVIFCGPRQTHLSPELYSVLTGVAPYTPSLYGLFHEADRVNYKTIILCYLSSQNHLMDFLLVREKAKIYDGRKTLADLGPATPP